MIRTLFGIVCVTCTWAQVQNYKPVTQDMLTNPSPNDWLMFSRTYDAQRFSPLNQINKQNVNQLGLGVDPGPGERDHGEHPVGA